MFLTKPDATLPGTIREIFKNGKVYSSITPSGEKIISLFDNVLFPARQNLYKAVKECGLYYKEIGHDTYYIHDDNHIICVDDGNHFNTTKKVLFIFSYNNKFAVYALRPDCNISEFLKEFSQSSLIDISKYIIPGMFIEDIDGIVSMFVDTMSLGNNYAAVRDILFQIITSPGFYSDFTAAGLGFGSRVTLSEYRSPNDFILTTKGAKRFLDTFEDSNFKDVPDYELVVLNNSSTFRTVV